MPQFILKIDIGNDAMCTENHISRALNRIASEIDSVGMLYHQTYQIRDINGNVVGNYEVVGS